jgi:hypothetical protein
MAITALYRKYFQKSKIFLYPLLDIKRGTSVVPSETYLAWGTSYTTEDMKLICVYTRRNDQEYIQFEKNILLKHNRLCDYVIIDDTTSVFTFDFSDLKQDWYHFINGKYSKMNIDIRRKILTYFAKSSGNYAYIESYLFPDNHFKKYAELLDVPVALLKSVGELCSKPDMEKEMLMIEVADLENLKIIS